MSGEKVDPIAGIDKFLDNLFNDKEDQKKAKNYNDTIVQIIDEDETPIYSESIDNTQKIHLSKDELNVINNKNQLYTYGLTKDEIIQDDLKPKIYTKKQKDVNY